MNFAGKFFNRVLIFVLIGGVLGFNPVYGETFTHVDANQVIQIFSSYYRQIYGCSHFKEFVTVNKQFKCREKLQEILDVEARMNTAPGGEVLVGSMFNMMIKPELIHPNEIININVKVTAQNANMTYGRQKHPEFSGKVTFVKESGTWKIIELSQSKTEDGGRQKSTIKF